MEKYYVLNEKSLSGSSYPHYFKSLEKAKEKFYGKDALLVRSGAYIYKVPPEIYYSAK